MILAVSVGNSHITFGVHGKEGWLRRFRIQTVQARTPDEYMVLFAGLLSSAGIAAPPLTDS
jgi:pantothenate kinase type III